MPLLFLGTLNVVIVGGLNVVAFTIGVGPVPRIHSLPLMLVVSTLIVGFATAIGAAIGRTIRQRAAA